MKVKIAKVFPFLSSKQFLGSTSWYKSQNELEIPQTGFSETFFLLKFIFFFGWVQITTFTRVIENKDQRGVNVETQAGNEMNICLFSEGIFL